MFKSWTGSEASWALITVLSGQATGRDDNKGKEDQRQDNRKKGKDRAKEREGGEEKRGIKYLKPE